ncbi:MAG TPA: hypothetical protein VF711_04600 [Acidimicrobiales bacterium]|jgi:hypothetical protein
MSTVDGVGSRGSLTSETTTVELIDGPHELRFDLAALSRLEDEFGSMEAIDTALKAKPIRSIQFLLWVGLGCQGTEEDTGHLVSAKSLNSVLASINDALQSAFGDAGSGDAGPTQPPTAAELAVSRTTSPLLSSTESPET